MLEQFRVDTTANGNVEDTNIQDVAPRVVVAALKPSMALSHQRWRTCFRRWQQCSRTA